MPVGVPPEIYFRQFAQFQCRTYLRSRIRQSRHEQLTDLIFRPATKKIPESPLRTGPSQRALPSPACGALDEGAYDLLDRRYLQSRRFPDLRPL